MDIKTKDRLTLKSYFRKNQIPTEANFADLLDAMLNQKDDGIAKLPGDPLSIAAAGDASTPQRLINFYGSLADSAPAWTLQMNPRDAANKAYPGFSISEGGGTSRLFIDKATGYVGIGTIQPATPLHIVTKTGGDAPGYGNPMAGGQHIEFGAAGMWGLLNSYGILHTWETDSLFIGLKDEGANRKDAVIAFGDDPQESLRILFTPYGNPPPAPLECLRITSAGNVGIGTATPSHRFHVLAADAVGLFESSGTQAYLRLSTSEGLGNRVEITNRPGGRLSLWTAGAGDVFNISRDGFVGIGTTGPGAKLDILANTSTWWGWYEAIRFSQSAHSAITHPGGGLLFGMHSDRHFYFGDTVGNKYLLHIDAPSNTTALLAGTNPIYFTKNWNGFPDGVTNASEISNDTGGYKTLMIIGNKSAGLGRRVSVWDRFEVNGTFVNNSSIEHKQDVEALDEEDYLAIRAKLLDTPIYRYRFKAPGIDGKVRIGVISERSPEEILDETGKFVSFLDYAGFLFAALKAQAREIERLAALVEAGKPA